METRVLVVGGAGYIGGAVTEALLKKNIPFTVYDNLLYEHQYLKPVDFIYGDVRDAEKLGKLLGDFSHVIWLAGIVGDSACEINPALTVAVNQEALKWLVAHYDGRVIFPSTCSVYGYQDQMVNEQSPVNPLSLYAETKLQAEKYLQDGNYLILRLGTAYGISDSFSRLRMDLVVNSMTADAVTKGRLNIYGGGQWRPLIHVKDIAEIIVDNVESETIGMYNIVTTNLQMKDLAKRVSDVTGCDIEYTYPQEDNRNYHASAEKAMKDGVFTLKKIRDIEYAIREIAQLITSGRIKSTENDIYANHKHITNLFNNGQFI